MYELKKYRHEWNEDGELVVYDVPVFAEVVRTDDNGETLVFDKEFCEQAIQNAQTLFEINDGYMAPFHEEHNSLQPSNDPIVRKNLGRFLPKRLKETIIAEVNKFTEEVEPTQKHIVIADLVIKPEYAEAFDRGDYPYLSVEIKNPKFPEFSSLAALTSRPPEHKFSPLAIMPVQFAADGSYHCYFSEDSIMQTEQFGVKEIAQKLSQNWWSLKGKLASDPTFNKLINLVNSNMSNLDPNGKAKGHQGGEVNISPDVIASWIQSIPGMAMKLGTMFAEEEQQSMNVQGEKNVDENKQFGFLDKINRGLDVAQASLGARSLPENIKGIAKELELSQKGTPRFDSALEQYKKLGADDQQKIMTYLKRQKFAEGEDDSNAEDLPESSTVDQITALLPSASEEVLAQILALLQGAGEEVQQADDDSKTMTPSFMAQFAAESRKRRSIEEKFQLFCDLVDRRVSAIENTFEKKEALQFAELTLTREGISQRDQILKELGSKKTASEIKERAAFAAKYAGKDPAPLNQFRSSGNPKIEELKAKYPGRESLVLQFAERWEGNKAAQLQPIEKYVRIQLEGYQGRN